MVERKFLSNIENRESQLNTPVFSIGRKLTAFTIEKSYFVESSVVVTMNFLRRYKLYFLRLIYGSSEPIKWLIDIAKREALLRLKESAKDATYIVNVRFAHTKTNKNEIEVLTYGTAIHLYQDTLGLYYLPEVPVKQSVYTTGSKLFRNLLFSIIFIFGAGLGIFLFEQNYSQSILNNITDEEEKTYWTYLSSKSNIAQHQLKPYLAETEQVIQNILNSVPKDQSLQKYNFKVFILDNESTKISLLPQGNILINKGALRNIKSENEMFFIFAHLLQHYKNRTHIKAMGSYIITPHLFVKTLGNDSFFAKWIVRAYPFYSITFTSEQEDIANKEAIKLLHEHYGHVGGIENSVFLTYHSGELSAAEYAKELKLDFNATALLDIELDEPQIIIDPVNVIPQANKNQDYKKIIDEFRVYSSSIIGKYTQSMSFMFNLLDPKSITSKEAIEQKMKFIDFGFANIEYYKNLIDTTISEYDHDLAVVLESVEDNDMKRILNSLWKQESDNVSKIAVFYFERDYEILKTQQGALNFLNNRVGKFSTTGGRISFSLKNDQESYDGLLARLQDQFSKTPTTINQGKR